jgi:hypothetical protein
MRDTRHRPTNYWGPVSAGRHVFAPSDVVEVTHPAHLYRALAWYDDVTHFTSGSLVAGLLVVALAQRVERVRWIAAATVVAPVLVGVGWEMYEHHTPRLRVYEWGDAVSDIWTNLLGGVAMLAYLRTRWWTVREGVVRGLRGGADERGLG